MQRLCQAALAAAFGLTPSLAATAADAPKPFTQDDVRPLAGDAAIPGSSVEMQ